MNMTPSKKKKRRKKKRFDMNMADSLTHLDTKKEKKSST